MREDIGVGETTFMHKSTLEERGCRPSSESVVILQRGVHEPPRAWDIWRPFSLLAQGVAVVEEVMVHGRRVDSRRSTVVLLCGLDGKSDTHEAPRQSKPTVREGTQGRRLRRG